MSIIGQILSGIGGLGMLVCFILLLVQMFKREKSGLAIVFIVLFFCCLLGHFIAFIYGWIKSKEWGISNIMLIWTVCVIIWIIGNALTPPDFASIQQQIEQAQKK